MDTRPLTTEDLTLALLSDTYTREQFGDVCSITELPEAKRDNIYIVNTDPHWLPGEHWVTCYFPEDGPPEFFDSLGHGLEYYHSQFQKFLLTNNMEGYYIYNTCRLQGYGSNTCGYFCMFSCLLRARGIPMNTIVNTFSNELWLNDWMVYEFIREHCDL